jgi:preprotein translocase subunit YajC
MNLFFVMLEAGGEGNPLMSLLPLILIIVVFWFFMIRPQMKRQKELQRFRSGLEKGDKILTTGGIFGKVESLQDNFIVIDCGNNIKLKVDRNAVLKDSTDLSQQK